MGCTSSTSSSKGNDDRKLAAKTPVTRSVKGAASLKSPPTPSTEDFMPSRSPIAIRYSAPGGRTVAVKMTHQTSLQAAASRGRSHGVPDSPTDQNSNATAPNTGLNISTLSGSPDPSSLQAAASRHDGANSNSDVARNTGRDISALFGSPHPSQGRRNSSSTPIVSPSDNANGNTCLARLGFVATDRSRADTTKCNYLKLAMIRGPGARDIYHFIFRCESYQSSRISAWHEKLFMDELIRQAPWIEALNILPNVLHWYENGEEVKNERNYNVRLFHMEVRSEDPPLLENLVELGKEICKNVNLLVQDNRLKLVVHPDHYFWFGFKHRTVWFDIVEEYAAVSRLLEVTGLPGDTPGFFERNRDHIHCCFRPGTLSLQIAQRLRGRMSDVNINERVMDFEGELDDDYEVPVPVEPETFDSGADLDETLAHTEDKND